MLFVSSFSFAGGSMYGANFGMGIPYLSQVGLNYIHPSKYFSSELSYNRFNMSVEDGSTLTVDLTKIEFALRWHPFAGSFYVGVGVGNQTLVVKATEFILANTVESKAEVKSNLITPQFGWLWGMSDGGLFGGIDFSLHSPSSPKTTFTTNADSTEQATQAYQDLERDVNEEGDKFGETSYISFTFLRIGYLF